VTASWLIAAIERLPSRVRRAGVAATAVLLLGGAITALTLEASTGGAGRRSTPAVHGPSRRAPARPLPPRNVRPPVSLTELHRADGAAGRFLVTYLQFAYGRGSAGSVKGVTPALRIQLIAERAQDTPAERGRHLRVVSLATVGTTPGFVVATATIEDGGIAAYRLRFTLQERDGRWLVSGVQEG
jgi:hypothetical protein